MSEPSPSPDPPRLGVVVLGASTFPNFTTSPSLNNESFARSAAAFRDLLSDPQAQVLGPVEILDLFNSDDYPLHIVKRIKEFLLARPTLSDVVIYYCGHGDFLADQGRTYVLTLRATEPDNEAFTALSLRQARLSLDTQLSAKRVFIVLDCCFAARAVAEWQSDAIDYVIEEQVFQVFPRRGTALITASSISEPALAPEQEDLTMFTGALVDILQEGIVGLGPQLSFRDVFDGTRARILERFGSKAAVPAIHAPHQPDGDVSFNPFFANRAFAPPAPSQPTASELENFELALADLDRPLPRTRLAALETLADLAEKTVASDFRELVLQEILRASEQDDSSTVRSRGGLLLQRLVEAGALVIDGGSKSSTEVQGEGQPTDALYQKESKNQPDIESILADSLTQALAQHSELVPGDGSDTRPDAEVQSRSIANIEAATAESSASPPAGVAPVIPHRASADRQTDGRQAEGAPARRDRPARRSAALLVGTIALTVAGLILWDVTSPQSTLRGIVVSLLKTAGIDASGESWDTVANAVGAAVTGTRAIVTVNGFEQFGRVEWTRSNSGRGVIALARFPERNLTFRLVFQQSGTGLSNAVFRISYDAFAAPEIAVSEPITAFTGMAIREERYGRLTALHGFSQEWALGFWLRESDSSINEVLLTTKPWLDAAFATEKALLVLTLERNADALRLWTEVLSARAP
jgi:hypothetical protein